MITKGSMMEMIAALAMMSGISIPSDESFMEGRFSDWEQDNRNPPNSMKQPKPLSKKQKAKKKSKKIN